jgi:hypothetical protein
LRIEEAKLGNLQDELACLDNLLENSSGTPATNRNGK